MKSIFDPAVESEIIERIQSLQPSNAARWGKMNVFQMVRHCSLCEDMYLGKVQIKRAFIGRLFGRMVLKQVLKDDKPFKINSPTSKQLTTPAEEGDLEALKRAWIDRILQYQSYTKKDFIHPFFGPLTKEQIGMLDYKHVDHHLRQFGA